MIQWEWDSCGEFPQPCLVFVLRSLPLLPTTPPNHGAMAYKMFKRWFSYPPTAECCPDKLQDGAGQLRARVPRRVPVGRIVPDHVVQPKSSTQRPNSQAEGLRWHTPHVPRCLVKQTGSCWPPCDQHEPVELGESQHEQIELPAGWRVHAAGQCSIECPHRFLDASHVVSCCLF